MKNKALGFGLGLGLLFVITICGSGKLEQRLQIITDYILFISLKASVLLGMITLNSTKVELKLN